jgi:hypothetical protein
MLFLLIDAAIRFIDDRFFENRHRRTDRLFFVIVENDQPTYRLLTVIIFIGFTFAATGCWPRPQTRLAQGYFREVSKHTIRFGIPDKTQKNYKGFTPNGLKAEKIFQWVKWVLSPDPVKAGWTPEYSVDHAELQDQTSRYQKGFSTMR